MKESKLVKIAKYIEDNGLELADLSINGLGYASIGILYEIDKEWKYFDSKELGFYLLIVVFILNIVFGVLILRKRRRLSEYKIKVENLSNKVQLLENDIENLYSDFFSLFNDQLAIIYHRLNFTANERISVYRHKNSKFEIIGRYSLNNKLAQVRRKSYPDSEGFIKNAWESENGEFSLNNLPEFVDGQKQKYYRAILKECAMPADSLRDIRFKGRSYYLKSLTDSANLNRKAIIVFESFETDKFDSETINSILEEEDQRLTLFIEKMKTNGNENDLANIKGF
ncbi:hypothetical protein [Oceanihabitans sediminis]|uniref:hypothetical protein n=1 Tax=Oceanihabitans sediminis TaxID=1812012 RepID=UPI003A9501F0